MAFKVGIVLSKKAVFNTKQHATLHVQRQSSFFQRNYQVPSAKKLPAFREVLMHRKKWALSLLKACIIYHKYIIGVS